MDEKGIDLTSIRLHYKKARKYGIYTMVFAFLVIVAAVAIALCLAFGSYGLIALCGVVLVGLLVAFILTKTKSDREYKACITELDELNDKLNQ